MRASVPLLEVVGLGKLFGGVEAMKDVGLSMPPGEIRALIGPNGAGKTTFLNLVTGVYKPSAGSIRFDGRSLVGMRPSRIAAVGVMRTFQHTALFEGLDVCDNVAISAFARQRWMLLGDVIGSRRAREAAAASRAEALKWLAFVGLEAKASRSTGSLTPAERRLVEVARTMAAEPRLILLDEPFAGMTQPEAEALFRLIQKVREQGVGVLVIDHNIRLLLKLADAVTVLSFGRKIGEGTPAQVRGSQAVVDAYLGQD